MMNTNDCEWVDASGHYGFADWVVKWLENGKLRRKKIGSYADAERFARTKLGDDIETLKGRTHRKFIEHGK